MLQIRITSSVWTLKILQMKVIHEKSFWIIVQSSSQEWNAACIQPGCAVCSWYKNNLFLIKNLTVSVKELTEQIATPDFWWKPISLIAKASWECSEKKSRLWWWCLRPFHWPHPVKSNPISHPFSSQVSPSNVIIESWGVQTFGPGKVKIGPPRRLKLTRAHARTHASPLNLQMCPIPLCFAMVWQVDPRWRRK